MLLKNKNFIKKIFEHPIIVLISSFLIPLLALIWDYVIDKVDGIIIIAISFFIFIIIIIILLIIQSILNSSLKEEFYSKISILEKFIESSGTGWISTNEEISFIEKTALDITVITHDLNNDIYDEDISNAVSENLQKDKKYLYILPKNNNTLSLIEEYKRKHDFNKTQVQIIFIEEKDFSFLNEIVIYDLFNKRKIIAFSMYPSKDFTLQIKLDTEHTNKIVGIVKNLIHTNKKINLIDDNKQKNIF